MYLIHFFDYAELHCTKNAADNSGASSSVTTGGLLASSTSCISITHKKVSYYNKILLKRTAPAGESGRILPARAVLII